MKQTEKKKTTKKTRLTRKETKKEKRERLTSEYGIKINTCSLEKLQKFFDDHHDYKSYELACKYGIPVRTIRFWKTKLGIKNDSYWTQKLVELKTIRPKIIYNTIEDPRIWDNKKWFEEMYVNKKYGAYIISQMIGASIAKVYHRLKKYGIPRRNLEESRRSKNKYCNKEWLTENYINKKKSLRELARVANVSRYTISNWLVHYGMMTRNEHEANSHLY